MPWPRVASCWWATTTVIGDLSGGQILKNIAQKAMNMEVMRACASTSLMTSLMRRRSRHLSLRNGRAAIDQAMADRIVEGNHAFHLNMNMFKELEGNLVAAIGKVLFGFLTRRQRAGSTEAAAA